MTYRTFSVRCRGLSCTRPPPIPVDPRLGPPPQQLQTDRLPTYRPTDGRAFIYLQTSLCNSSSHHHHHPRTILGDILLLCMAYPAAVVNSSTFFTRPPQPDRPSTPAVHFAMNYDTNCQ
ncbi:hypothetical protein QTP88_005587 [Uroleucon formosanum]